jgi:hypothetical protein
MLPFSDAELAARFAPEWYAASLTIQDEAALWLQRSGHTKRLAILAPLDHMWLSQFSGESQSFDQGYVLKWCPTDYANARALHAAVPNLKPTLLGLMTSAGCGDRMGLATPGHVRAFEAVRKQLGAEPIAPIFAQQSIREMTRTSRTPQAVMADATWGAFEGGWRDRVGADADHLKASADIDVCAGAGFTFYTIDPGAHVDSAADVAAPDAIGQKVAALRWADLASSPDDVRRQYADRTFDLDDRRIALAAEGAWRAAAKYGNAIAHVTTMYRHLAAKGVPFELEVSVDETDTPTTHAEHIYIVSELKRLGVKWVSLAPRYVGRFEKGVDYVGDVKALEADLAGHAAIARTFGPYKLSLHSGSDKFSVYPLIVAATKGLVHLKTAGTSYLEALRTLAAVTPALFREILEFSIERYEADRVSYHVSADVPQVPHSRELTNDELPGLLNQFDAREVLHVTFGSVLAQFGGDIRAALVAHELDYYHALETHFVRHLTPFAHRA